MKNYARHQRKEPKENAQIGALGADGYYLSYNLDAKVFAHPGKVKGGFFSGIWWKPRFALGQLLIVTWQLMTCQNRTFALD